MSYDGVGCPGVKNKFAYFDVFHPAIPKNKNQSARHNSLSTSKSDITPFSPL